MLALRMGRTIDELMHSMSSSEFSVWVELYNDDQWGEAREDFRAGQICATIGNFAGKVMAKDASALKPADFMPTLVEDEVAEEPDPVTFFTAVAASKTFNK